MVQNRDTPQARYALGQALDSPLRTRDEVRNRSHDELKQRDQHGLTKPASPVGPAPTTPQAMKSIIRKQRPVLPGESLPPLPPKYKKPAPQLPPLK